MTKQCPHAKSNMTPCVIKDGPMCFSTGGRKMCDFTDSGQCAAAIPAACVCIQPGYRAIKRQEEVSVCVGCEKTADELGIKQ